MKRQQVDPTIPAKQVWKYLHPRKPWPKGLVVKWSNRLSLTLGETSFNHDGRPSTITLAHRALEIEPNAECSSSRDGEGGVLAVLVHELAHVACAIEDHGPAFHVHFAAYLKRLSLRL